MKLSIYYRLLIFHVFLGLCVFIFKPFALLYFVFIIGFFIYKIYFAKEKRVFFVLLACAYVVGCEVFLRMNDGTIMYEACKYLIIVFCIMGLFTNSFVKQSLIYILFIFLLIPAVYVAVSQLGFETRIRQNIAFSLSGPVCLGISAIFCYGKTVTYSQIKIILLAFLFPLISMGIYLLFATPNIEETLTSTGSNFEASGGFGPNQVSTVLGIGIFVLAIRFFMFKEHLKDKIIDLIILFLLFYRALVTFSRGGVITAGIMILVFLALYYIKVNYLAKFKIKLYLSVFLAVVVFIWLISSSLTNGFIDKRYANEDAKGRKKDITTGRKDLTNFEINAFVENPFLGIGVGRVTTERFNQTGINAASHNEMSRIIAEHGLLGLLGFFILVFTPLFYRMKNRTNIFFFSFYIFWIATINHSAMRIAAPAFIYALCLLNIKYEIANNKKFVQANTNENKGNRI